MFAAGDGIGTAAKRLVWSGTARRLFAAFASLIGLYVLAAGFAIHGLVQIRDELAQARGRVEGLQLALELASAVRDQYAHLAHTIIIGDDSHVKFYEEARDRAAALSRRMGGFAAGTDERQWTARIEQALAEMDSSYRNRILPGVLAGRSDLVRDEHGQVLSSVTVAQDNTSFLAGRFSESVTGLQTLVSGIQRQTLVWAALFLLMAPAFAAGAGIVIGRSVARPLTLLKAGAERIGAGDLDTRIDIESADEFGSLARRFNAMAASLKEHQRRLLQNEKLAGIGRLAAGVAHEINNPLGVILGYARVLGKKAEGGLQEDLRIIEAETLRCKEIVDGLLDLSRPIKPGGGPVDLRELADDVAARLSNSDPAKGATVGVDGGAHAHGDALKLRQIVFNLVKNAMEAAGPGGRVSVRIADRGDHAELAVEDSGPGFPEEIRERLFEPFLTTKRQGTGLGLAVSRAIALAHGGDLLVDAAGGETRLVLRLPRPPGGGAP
jgi:signal transduction histidine kinase